MSGKRRLTKITWLQRGMKSKRPSKRRKERTSRPSRKRRETRRRRG